MTNRVLTAALVFMLLAPIVLVASGGDPRTFWGELKRAATGAFVAHAIGNTMPVPFGGDDTGVVIPLDKNRLKCQAAVVRNYARLVACILKCHVTKADALFKEKEFDEEACESADPVKSCRAKYDKQTAVLVGKQLCPPCLDAAHQAMLASDIESTLDTGNQGFYCSP